MRTLRYRLRYRRGDPDGHSFAFFVVGTLVVIAVAFFLGFQLGRYVEKSAVKVSGRRIVSTGPATENGVRTATSAEIRKEMSAFSAEALKIPGVAPPAAVPPTAREDLKMTESEATFPESLSRKDPSPEPMGKKKEKARISTPSGEAKFILQAGAMKTRETADAMRKRIGRSGYNAKVIHATTRKIGEVYRVRVGPFGSRDEAMKAMKAIRTEMKIDVILLKG